MHVERERIDGKKINQKKESQKQTVRPNNLQWKRNRNTYSQPMPVQEKRKSLQPIMIFSNNFHFEISQMSLCVCVCELCWRWAVCGAMATLDVPTVCARINCIPLHLSPSLFWLLFPIFNEIGCIQRLCVVAADSLRELYANDEPSHCSALQFYLASLLLQETTFKQKKMCLNKQDRSRGRCTLANSLSLYCI